jgi:hypothetical protein
MKMQPLVRMQILMGMGAALLLASSGRAQQTMDPASSYSVTSEPSEKTAMVPVIESDGSESVIAMALGSRQATRQETELARVMVADVIMLAILVAGIAAIAMYAMAATRRNRTLEPVLRDRLRTASYGPASGATTH